MSIARTYSAQPSITHAHIVAVETDLSRGLFSFSVVGLPGKAVEEARDRIASAIKNIGFPALKTENQKVVISLAPADLKKEGPLFDLPMAISYLVATGAVRADVSKTVFIGELGLDGTLHPVRGALPCARIAFEKGFTEIVVPVQNQEEAALVRSLRVIPARSLRDVIQHIDSTRPDHAVIDPAPETTIQGAWDTSSVLLDDVRGQESAKRGLVIAAAGRHNVIMAGPPGTGKTMLARALQGILPPLRVEEALEVTAIHSIAGSLEPISLRPPFRSPHHTASYSALVGGGAYPRPGEVTLAHRGVLFLDEFPEFERRALDALRQPLEDRVVTISRVQHTVLFPADFILVAALNPTRGGDEGENYTLQMQQTYKHKISGPILDRIDLWLQVPHVPYETLSEKRTASTQETDAAREKILRAREVQQKRFAGRGITANGDMSARDIEACIEITEPVRALLMRSAEKLRLSPRGYHRLIKVSRTIADLAGDTAIEEKHVLEALSYRSKM